MVCTVCACYYQSATQTENVRVLRRKRENEGETQTDRDLAAVLRESSEEP